MAGLTVVEVPTVLRPDGRDRPPHLRPWRDGCRHVRLLIGLRARAYFRRTRNATEGGVRYRGASDGRPS